MTARKHEVAGELLSSLLANDKTPEDLIGENGLFKQLIHVCHRRPTDTRSVLATTCQRAVQVVIHC